MAATLTITPDSDTQAFAGMMFRFLATQSGGTNWTVGDSVTTPLSLQSGPNAYPSPCIISQHVTSTTQAYIVIYCGSQAGAINFTDPMNGTVASLSISATLAQRAIAGKTIYAGGSSREPDAPLLAIHGTPGSTIYNYQLVGVTAGGGTTATRTVIAAEAWANMPQSSAYTSPDEGSVSMPNMTYYTDTGFNTVNNAPDSMDASNYVIVTLPPLPAGIVSFNLIRFEQQNYDFGGVWLLIASGLSGNTTYNDQSSVNSSNGTLWSGNAYNTTTTASDSNNGLTALTPVATLAKAFSLATSGDLILISGGCYDNLPALAGAINGSAGVSVHGATGDPTIDFLKATRTLNEASTNNANIVPGNNSDWCNLGMETDIFNQVIFGNNPSDPATNGVRAFNCRIRGLSNALRISQPLSGILFVDSELESAHGTCGLVSTAETSILNLVRTRIFCRGGTIVSGAGTIPLQLITGFVLTRDCTLLSSVRDSQIVTNRVISGIYMGSNVSTEKRGGMFINTLVRGDTDELFAGTSPAAWQCMWFINSPIDAYRNADAITKYGSAYESILNGVYQTNPVGTASGGGGSGNISSPLPIG